MTIMPAWTYAMCLGFAVLPLVIDESVKLALHFGAKAPSRRRKKAA